MKKLFPILGLLLYSTSLLAQPVAPPATIAPAIPLVGPNYTDIVGRIEMQPIEGGRLIYWDQAAADAMGIQTVPGRVGNHDFERDVLGQIGYEVRAGSQAVTEAGKFKIGHIENDAHGGSGRAGYIQTRGGAWVNIKGIGQTGYGHTNGNRGPPIPNFASHRDGSATLEEAIKETISARAATNELATPSSRVLAIIDTGRTMSFKDGRVVRLATIVREPMRRYDRALAQGATVRALNMADTLAQLNVKRFLKGDIVNQSNIGAGGEMIDFGTFTSTGGHTPAVSSQDTSVLGYEPKAIDDFPTEIHMRRIGEHLLQQWGLPQSVVEAGAFRETAAAKKFEDLGTTFRNVVYTGNEQVKVDFAALTPEQTFGRFRYHELLRDVAADYLERPQSQEAFVKTQVEKLERSIGHTINQLEEAKRAPLRELHTKLFSQAWEGLEEVSAAKPEIRQAGFSKKVRQIAHFKSRETHDLVRPVLMTRIGDALNQASQDPNPAFLQNFIDDTVRYNRLSTAPPSDGLFHVVPDGVNTDYYIRAERYPNGTFGPKAYPEVRARANAGESMGFRTTSDAWKSHKDLPATLVETPQGLFLKTTLPTRDFPLASGVVEMSPYSQHARDGQKWFDVPNLRGPMHAYSHQLGLAPDYSFVSPLMEDNYGVKLGLRPESFTGQRSLTPDRLESIIRNIRDPALKGSMEHLDLLGTLAPAQVKELYADPVGQKLLDSVKRDLIVLPNFAPHLSPKVRDAEYARIMIGMRKPKGPFDTAEFPKLKVLGFKTPADLETFLNKKTTLPAHADFVASETLRFMRGGKTLPSSLVTALRALPNPNMAHTMIRLAYESPDLSLRKSIVRVIDFRNPSNLGSLIAADAQQASRLESVVNGIENGHLDPKKFPMASWEHLFNSASKIEKLDLATLARLDALTMKHPVLGEALVYTANRAGSPLRKTYLAHFRNNLSSLDKFMPGMNSRSRNAFAAKMMNESSGELGEAFEKNLVDAYRKSTPEARVHMAEFLRPPTQPSETRKSLERMIRRDANTDPKLAQAALSNKVILDPVGGKPDPRNAETLISSLRQMIEAKDTKAIDTLLQGVQSRNFSFSKENREAMLHLMAEVPDLQVQGRMLSVLRAAPPSTQKLEFLAGQILSHKQHTTSMHAEFHHTGGEFITDEFGQLIQKRYGDGASPSSEKTVGEVAKTLSLQSKMNFSEAPSATETHRILLEAKQGSNSLALRKILVENLSRSQLSREQVDEMLKLAQQAPELRESVVRTLAQQTESSEAIIPFLRDALQSDNFFERNLARSYLAKHPGQHEVLAANIGAVLNDARTPVHEKIFTIGMLAELPTLADTNFQNFFRSPQWASPDNARLRKLIIQHALGANPPVPRARLLSYVKMSFPLSASQLQDLRFPLAKLPFNDKVDLLRLMLSTATDETRQASYSYLTVMMEPKLTNDLSEILYKDLYKVEAGNTIQSAIRYAVRTSHPVPANTTVDTREEVLDWIEKHAPKDQRRKIMTFKAEEAKRAAIAAAAAAAAVVPDVNVAAGAVVDCSKLYNQASLATP